MRNVLAHVGESGHRVVSAFSTAAFAQEAPDAANTQWQASADQIWPKAPRLAATLDNAEPDALTYPRTPWA